MGDLSFCHGGALLTIDHHYIWAQLLCPGNRLKSGQEDLLRCGVLLGALDLRSYDLMMMMMMMMMMRIESNRYSISLIDNYCNLERQFTGFSWLCSELDCSMFFRPGLVADSDAQELLFSESVKYVHRLPPRNYQLVSSLEIFGTC